MLWLLVLFLLFSIFLHCFKDVPTYVVVPMTLGKDQHCFVCVYVPFERI